MRKGCWRLSLCWIKTCYYSMVEFFRACELEDVEACWLLSTWYIGRDAKFVTSGAKKPVSYDVLVCFCTTNGWKG